MPLDKKLMKLKWTAKMFRHTNLYKNNFLIGFWKVSILLKIAILFGNPTAFLNIIFDISINKLNKTLNCFHWNPNIFMFL